MILPNVFIAGAQKAGTTWLSRCLARQPFAFLPAEKELHFFTKAVDVRAELPGYAARYAESTARWNIDATPNYLCTPGTEVRLAEVCPDARFVITLRDPVERTLSAVRHHLARERFGPGATLDSVVRDVLATGHDPWEILDQSAYADGFERWLEHFDRERFHVVIFEEEIEPDNGRAALAGVANFLGEPEFAPPLGSSQYRSPTPRSRTASRLLARAAAVGRVLAPLNRMVGDDRAFEARESTRELLDAWFAPQLDRLPELIDRRPKRWRHR